MASLALTGHSPQWGALAFVPGTQFQHQQQSKEASSSCLRYSCQLLSLTDLFAVSLSDPYALYRRFLSLAAYGRLKPSPGTLRVHSLTYITLPWPLDNLVLDRDSTLKDGFLGLCNLELVVIILNWYRLEHHRNKNVPHFSQKENQK
jgi:hypothetical protein